MRVLIEKFLIGKAFVALVRNPLKTEKIFEISDRGRRNQREGAAVLMRPILESEEFERLWLARHSTTVEIESLRKLPSGTFGSKVAEFLDTHKFQPNAFPVSRNHDRLDYLTTRVRQTHDLWHVLTGYETTVAGELALQAFSMAQLGSPLSALILAAGILHVLIYRPMEIRNTFEAIYDGYQKGKVSKTLLTAPLDRHWGVNLNELRSDLGLI